MKKIELHAKTKYSFDFESTIDVEGILWNAKENGERGIVFVDKDSIISFPKIERIYKNLCSKDESFKNFKIGYGVQLTSIIDSKEYEVVVLIKKQDGLFDLYKIMSLYLDNFNKKIPIKELSNQNNLLLGLILNKDSINLDLSIFDYLEINSSIDISSIKDKNKIVYSNIPNALFEGELKAKEVLYFYQHIDNFPECRLYLDTEETLKEFNDEEIVITNSNMIFDNLDNVVINDGKFYTNHVDNFDEFERLVINSFKRKYKSPSQMILKRLNEELSLIKELDYTYFYDLLIIITDYCKNNAEYYQLYGYINNSLVAYALNLTEIEPFNLPYELFFSKIPSLEIKVAPKFYHEKLFPFLIDKFNNNLIRYNSRFKLKKDSIPRVIKYYEIKNKKVLESSDKDYMAKILNDIPLYRKDCMNTGFYVVPRNKTVFNFTPYEVRPSICGNNIKEAYFDYQDLSNNLIRMQFILSDDIEHISNMIKKTNAKVEYCNDKKVFNLFRNTEDFNCKFRILDKSTGTLNISGFDDEKIENKLINISNIWIEDLIKLLVKPNNVIIKDDLYNGLKQKNLDDVAIFNVISCLEDSDKAFVSKAFILNKIRISYMQMYYKLYYPKEYYEEMISSIDDNYIKNEVFQYDIKQIKQRYFDFKESSHLSIEEYEEYKLLRILIEMYERGIKFKFSNKSVNIYMI